MIIKKKKNIKINLVLQIIAHLGPMLVITAVTTICPGLTRECIYRPRYTLAIYL